MKELVSTAANHLALINADTGKRTPQVEIAITTCEPVYRLDPANGTVNRKVESWTFRFCCNPTQLRDLATKFTNMAEDSETMHSMKEGEPA
jgi:hypothetical protein